MTREETIALMTAAVWPDGTWSAEAASMYDALVRAGALVSQDPVDLRHECCEEVHVLRRSLGRAWSAWLSLLVDEAPHLIEDMRASSPELMQNLLHFLTGQKQPVRRPTPVCETTTSSPGLTPS